MATKVEGLQAFRAKVLKRFPEEARRVMREANQKNADEFAALVRRTVPKGGAENGHLLDTLTVTPGDAEFGGLGVKVSIGSAGNPYAFHLEGGHRTAGGTHVPAKPYWNPSKRAISKKAKSRAARALNKAVKAVAL